MAPTPQEGRYDGLDAVRAGAMLLGIVYHACMAYVPDIGRWYVVEDLSTSAFFEVLEKTLHAVRMELFFTLSGFFAHLVLERRGLADFLRDRFRRLVVPFAVAAPLGLGLDFALRRWSAARGTLSPAYPGQDAFLFRPLHLWFLEVAFLLSLSAWALSAAGLTPRLLRATAFLTRVPEAALGLALATWAGLEWLGEPNPAFTFAPEAATLAHFLPFFLVGFVLWGHRRHLEALRRCGWMAPAGLALAAWVFSRPLQWEPGGHALAALAAWLATLGSFSLALRLRAADRPALRAAVESSYWVYLVHYPLVVAGQVALARVPAGAGLKCAAVVAGAWALSYASFRLVVRASRLGPWVGVALRPTAPPQ